MTGAGSLFTEAIEDHLALKKQNTTLEERLPLSGYLDKVGDPLDRYPGAIASAAERVETVTDEATADDAPKTDEAATPEVTMAMDAAQPLAGMAPSLSLVDDLDDPAAAAERITTVTDETPITDALADDAIALEVEQADVVRFPGGAGPREAADAIAETDTPAEATTATDADAATPVADAPAEEPVIVIDTDEPLTPDAAIEPVSPERARKRTWFGLKRRKKDAEAAPVLADDKPKTEGDGWFGAKTDDETSTFTWDD